MRWTDRARAKAAIGRTPFTGRTVPSRASSPTNSERFDRVGGEQPCAAQDPDGDGDVVGAAVLAQIGGGQVHHDLARGHLDAGVLERAPDPGAPLLHPGVGQADDLEARQAGGDVDLDVDGGGLDAGDGAERTRESTWGGTANGMPTRKRQKPVRSARARAPERPRAGHVRDSYRRDDCWRVRTPKTFESLRAGAQRQRLVVSRQGLDRLHDLIMVTSSPLIHQPLGGPAAEVAGFACLRPAAAPARRPAPRPPARTPSRTGTSRRPSGRWRRRCRTTGG
jgi:hypothetical protein